VNPGLENLDTPGPAAIFHSSLHLFAFVPAVAVVGGRRLRHFTSEETTHPDSWAIMQRRE